MTTPNADQYRRARELLCIEGNADGCKTTADYKRRYHGRDCAIWMDASASDRLATELARLDAEVARLRAALHKIATGDGYSGGTLGGFMIETARTALAARTQAADEGSDDA